MYNNCFPKGPFCLFRENFHQTIVFIIWVTVGGTNFKGTRISDLIPKLRNVIFITITDLIQQQQANRQQTTDPYGMDRTGTRGLSQTTGHPPTRYWTERVSYGWTRNQNGGLRPPSHFKFQEPLIVSLNPNVVWPQEIMKNQV